MKKKLLSGLTIATMLFSACGSGEKETVSEENTMHTEMETTSFTANSETSNLKWKGEVAGVYGHSGNIKLKSGTLSLEGDKVVGGEFTVDMRTIVPTDSASFTAEEGHRISDLQGHLTKNDFFNTELYPTSTFKITGVDGNTVTGNLTVRDKTNEEKINVESIDITDGTATVKGKLVFNRQKYDVAWVHYMKDMVLSDDIVLDITLVATK